MLMGIICWIVLGLVAGFIASKIVSGRGEGVPMDIILGIVGLLIGGWIFNAIGSGRRHRLQHLEPFCRRHRGHGGVGDLARHPRPLLSRIRLSKASIHKETNMKRNVFTAAILFIPLVVPLFAALPGCFEEPDHDRSGMYQNDDRHDDRGGDRGSDHHDDHGDSDHR